MNKKIFRVSRCPRWDSLVNSSIRVGLVSPAIMAVTTAASRR
ncbi:MAG TPA: hypothetical protein PKI19_13435 [Elusimicrobiales bacterium]|nr:hypothetical protein [Elusimicrobiales bacterium]